MDDKDSKYKLHAEKIRQLPVILLIYNIVLTLIGFTGLMLNVVLCFKDTDNLRIGGLSDFLIVLSGNGVLVAAGIIIVTIGAASVGIIFYFRKVFSVQDRLTREVLEITTGVSSISRKIMHERGPLLPVVNSMNSVLDLLNQLVQEMKNNASSIMESSESILLFSNEFTEEASRMETASDDALNTSHDLKKYLTNSYKSLKDQITYIESIWNSLNEFTTSITSSIEAVNSDAAAVGKSSSAGSDLALDCERELQITVDAINKLHDRTRGIEEILNMINDISDQVNLLAINASIEAARAGDQGRGFAVVAEEISKLSVKTAESTSNIEKLIKGAISDVKRGKESLEKTERSIEKIAGNIRQTNEMAKNINLVSSEQSGETMDIMEKLEELKGIMGEFSNTIEYQKVSVQSFIEIFDEFRKMSLRISEGINNLRVSAAELGSSGGIISGLIEKFKI